MVGVVMVQVRQSLLPRLRLLPGLLSLLPSLPPESVTAPATNPRWSPECVGDPLEVVGEMAELRPQLRLKRL